MRPFANYLGHLLVKYCGSVGVMGSTLLPATLQHEFGTKTAAILVIKTYCCRCMEMNPYRPFLRHGPVYKKLCIPMATICIVWMMQPATTTGQDGEGLLSVGPQYRTVCEPCVSAVYQ